MTTALRAMFKFILKRKVFFDLFCIATLVALSLFHVFYFLNAEAIVTHYPDWFVQAFRVKMLDAYGFTSWTHVWSNGISLWKSYQFIPHVITLGVSHLFAVDIPRALVLTTIGAFVFFRISTYVVLRLLKFSPFTSLLCTLLTFVIAQFWSGVADFSILFAFIAFPVYLYLWIQFYKGHIAYWYPFFVGISFYIHPTLGVINAALWALGVIFGERTIVHRSTLIQAVIFLIASSLFWGPLVAKESFLYSNTNLASLSFLNTVLSQYEYFGLSAAIIIGLVVSLIRYLFPVSREYNWTKPLSLFFTGYFLLVILATQVELPRLIAQFQFTRGVSLVGIGVCFLIAPMVAYLLSKQSLLVRIPIVCAAMAVVVQGIYFSSIFSPSPSMHAFDRPITSFIDASSAYPIDASRVWGPPIDNASYFSPLTIRLPNSYMGHLEPNQLSPRLGQLISYQNYTDKIPASHLDRITDYFKVSGVGTVFFEATSPFTKTLLSEETGYITERVLSLDRSIWYVFRVPWGPRQAVAVDDDLVSEFAPFPKDLIIEHPADQARLDSYIHEFSQSVYDSRNIPLPVTYPTQTSLWIDIPASAAGRVVYVNESHDSGWKAILNGSEKKISPAGPQYMTITVDEGDYGTLVLSHSWTMRTLVNAGGIAVLPVILLLAQLPWKRFPVSGLRLLLNNRASRSVVHNERSIKTRRKRK